MGTPANAAGEGKPGSGLPTPRREGFSLRAAFHKAAGFAREHWKQALGITAAVALGTTALSPMMLSTTLGAAALMGLSLYTLAQTSDAVVDNAAALGKKKGISPLVIGVALGVLTSLPELLVSIGSIVAGSPQLAIGNIVGSNIGNILFVMGMTAAIAGVARGGGLGWKFNTLAMGGATLGFATQMAMGALNRPAGIAMMALTALYMFGGYKISEKDMKDAPPAAAPADEEKKGEFHPEKAPSWLNTAWALAGVGGLIFSADMLVKSALQVGPGLGLSEAVIGTLAVALGTSLPELMVNVKSALKGKTDMAIGNILGSNVFNILTVGGALALARTAIPPEFSPGTPIGLLNTAAFLGSAGLFAKTLFGNEGGMKKWHGWAYMALYLAYVGGTVALGAPPVAPGPEALPPPVVAPVLPPPG